jgi:hypothetical protein
MMFFRTRYAAVATAASSDAVGEPCVQKVRPVMLRRDRVDRVIDSPEPSHVDLRCWWCSTRRPESPGPGTPVIVLTAMRFHWIHRARRENLAKPLGRSRPATSPAPSPGTDSCRSPRGAPRFRPAPHVRAPLGGTLRPPATPSSVVDRRPRASRPVDPARDRAQAPGERFDKVEARSRTTALTKLHAPRVEAS